MDEPRVNVEWLVNATTDAQTPISKRTIERLKADERLPRIDNIGTLEAALTTARGGIPFRFRLPIASQPPRNPPSSRQRAQNAANRRDHLEKQCRHPKTKWGRCPCPWWFTCAALKRRYRFSLDKYLGQHVASWEEARAAAQAIWREIRAGRFRGQQAQAPALGRGPLSFRAFADLWQAREGDLMLGQDPQVPTRHDLSLCPARHDPPAHDR